MAADWMIRTSTPTWLALANLQESADALRALPEIKSWDDVAATQATLNKARKEAAAARDAAWDAARAAAGDVLCRTVERLQTSAFELLDRMIAAGAQ